MEGGYLQQLLDLGPFELLVASIDRDLHESVRGFDEVDGLIILARWCECLLAILACSLELVIVIKIYSFPLLHTVLSAPTSATYSVIQLQLQVWIIEEIL